MKITFITLGFILILIMNLNAQNIDLGIKTGAGFASVNFTNIPGTDSNADIFSSTFSYGVNGTLNYKLNELLGFSLEPGMIKKGWTSDNINDHSNKTNLYYLQLPGLLDFYLLDGLFLSIGPEIDYLINAKVKSNRGSEDVTDLFRKFEFSGTTGVTYHIFDRYDVGFRYSHGLTKISDRLFWITDDDANTIKLKGYNQSLQFFIKFSIKNLR
ncbi:porin family protein [Gaoshiqia sp. Z1-71]|uniref:porin family protein n=1 Tax=Gaoshiqia hydrogeniformans TaxID=3290090 RepID=UPI003BF876D2